ncbi:MAG: hypothetical protein Q4C47_00875, partial [Planctomycetia bacterium]|nr:hypothetical protein [Planctomycetia bacterium]
RVVQRQPGVNHHSVALSPVRRLRRRDNVTAESGSSAQIQSQRPIFAAEYAARYEPGRKIQQKYRQRSPWRHVSESLRSITPLR